MKALKRECFTDQPHKEASKRSSQEVQPHKEKRPLNFVAMETTGDFGEWVQRNRMGSGR